MIFSDVVVFLLGAVGMTNIIVYSDLFTPIRDYLRSKLPEKVYFLDCPQCTGTWCGFISYFLMNSLYTRWFVFGCAVSFLATMATTLVHYLESRSFIEIGDE